MEGQWWARAERTRAHIQKKKKKKLEPGKTLVMITERDSWSWVILYENISPLLIPRLAIVLGE